MLLYEKKGAVGVLTINRPEALNAINSALLDALSIKAGEIASDAGVRCLIITGSGKAFAAGADIGEMKGLSREQAYEFGMRGHSCFSALEGLEIPVIAAVNGYALGGGCELALCADIRIAAERARFGQPEVGLGITPGFGGTQRLTRTINRAAAMEMILSARTFSAQEALAIGLVSRVVPGEELMPAAMELAEAIAANAPIAVRAAKKAMRRSYERELASDLEAEAALFASCFETEDQRMAMTAFVNKTQKAEFLGR